MKHETKFIKVMNQISNSEEFNQIVSTFDPHMTLVLTWSAMVNDNNSTQRTTVGQHFVQLRNIYETISCPPVAHAGLQSFTEHDEKINIYNVKLNLLSSATTVDGDRRSPNDV